MIIRTEPGIVRCIGRKALYYAALAIIANGLGAFTFWQSANCWAGQTVNVPVGTNLQTLVNQYPGGTIFSLAPGIHRLQSVVPQAGDAFVGQTGAIMSGAALLTTFTQSGSYWTAKVSVTQASSYPGTCNAATPACIYPEDLFFNSVPKTRVTSLAAVAAGKWYLNYSTGTAYMGDNPAGYTVEMSELPFAFTGAANSVSITNLIVEKYAGVAQTGAINGAAGGMWWSVGNNEVRYNHARGISTGNGMYVYGNNAHNNGQLGIGGSGNNFTIQSNQISYNNYAGYSYYWEAGGLKLSGAQNAMVEYNYSFKNGGPGLWEDVNCQNITFNQNQTTANTEAGILAELSTETTISNNYIWNDGYNPSGTGIWWGGGIVVSNSSSVSIYSNDISYCMNGIVGILANRGDAPSGQPYSLRNVDVTSNKITQTTGMAAGIAVEGTGFDNSVFTSWNNTFVNNTYMLSTAGGNYFYWLGNPMSLATFTTDAEL